MCLVASDQLLLFNFYFILINKFDYLIMIKHQKSLCLFDSCATFFISGVNQTFYFSYGVKNYCHYWQEG